VHIAGLIRHPHDAWLLQVARNLTDSVDGFLRGKRYLIHDRDPLFTEAFHATLRASGIKCLKLPARSPNLKGYASYCTSSCGSSVSCYEAAASLPRLIL
jgi:hypothetical protein